MTGNKRAAHLSIAFAALMSAFGASDGVSPEAVRSVSREGRRKARRERAERMRERAEAKRARKRARNLRIAAHGGFR